MGKRLSVPWQPSNSDTDRYSDAGAANGDRNSDTNSDCDAGAANGDRNRDAGAANGDRNRDTDAGRPPWPVL